MSAPRQMERNPPRLAAERRWRLVAVAGGAAILIGLVAVASRPVAPPQGDAAANPGPAVALMHVVEILGIALELLAVLILAVVFGLNRRRKAKDEPPEYHEPVPAPWWLKAIVVAVPLLAIGAIVYAIFNLRPVAPPPQPIELGPPPPAGSSPGDGVASALTLGWWEYLIAAALAVVAFAFFLRALRRPPPAFSPPAEPALRVRILAEAVGASLNDARRERDPRRAVIAAYATMERVLAERGLPRGEAEAPLEYMSRLFGALNVGQEAIRTLTHLFELARFSHHPIAPAAKAQAILALVSLQEELKPSS
ncbi:MAG TPA: DUF4129 domain-containing protein [Thermomicrobiales bacterium]|nr:DUF4129 domain-containing protein [Thermomicrobiales bacterium]